MLCLYAEIMYAQDVSAWRSAADKYLTTIFNGDPAFETPDTIETLRKAIAEEFKNGKADVALVHWLATRSAIEGDTNADDYYQEVLRRYDKQPYLRALFIMDYNRCNYTSEPDPAMIKSALSSFEEAKKDSTVIYLHALCDYGGALVSRKRYAEGLTALENARHLAAEIAGTKSAIYAEILSSLSSYYGSIGNLENEVKYREMSEKIEADHLGINQLYRIVFNDPLPYRSSTPSNSPIADAWRIAALFQYSPDQLYNPSFFLYEKAFAAEKLREVAQQLSPVKGYEEEYAAALLNEGVMDLEVYNEQASQSLEKAFKFYANALPKQKDHTGYVNAANFLACAYVGEGNYQDALKIFDNLEKVLSQLRLKIYKWYDKVHHNIIITSALAGDRAKVLAQLRPLYESKSYTIEHDYKERTAKYGDVLFEYGEYRMALEAYGRAHWEYWSEEERKFAQREKSYDADGNEIEMLSTENTVLDISATDASMAIHKFKPSGAAYTRLLYKLAQAEFMNQKFIDAREHILAYINEFYTRLEYMHINHHRGPDLYEIYRLKNELFPAYDLFQNVIMMDTTSEKEFIADNKARAYQQILDSKANIQFEYRHMRNVIESGNDEKLKNVFQLYIGQQNKLAQLKLANGNSKDIEDLTISIDTLKAYMSSKTAAMLVDAPSKTFTYWTDVKSALKRNEAAIEIRRFPKYDSGRFTNQIVYAAYVITPVFSNPEVVFLKNGNHLEGRGLKLYQNSIRLKLDDAVSYDTYWKSIQELLPTGTWKAYVSSDGAYSQINVNTLFNKENKKYLIEELTVYNVISTKAIRGIKDFTSGIKEATLMGRPAYYLDDPKELKEKNPFDNDPQRAITRAQIASGNITDLPGTQKEIEDIARILKKKKVNTKYFIGRESTEEAFKASTGDILHLATHGFWFREDANVQNADAMFNSGLLLAGVKNFYEQKSVGMREDGILTAYEVQGLNLANTELVVLSACETAAGHVQAGEGVYGLQRAFNIAGADKLIMSLWKVDDKATQELFSGFYNSWVNEGSSLLEAFQKSQLALRAKYNHPYYWGAFILVD